MCKVIGILNNKGGVGKTTSALNLGIGLAKKGKKVLLIDADSQGSLTSCLGYTEPDELEFSLAYILGNIIKDEEYDIHSGILHHNEGVDLLPGNIELSGIEVSLVNAMRREFILREYVDKIRNDYDYILIDCMPSLGMITINVMTAVDTIMIPVQAAYLSLKGLEQLIMTISRTKKYLNPNLGIEGIFITMVKARTNYGKKVISVLKETYGNAIRIFSNQIPSSVRAEECASEGISIYKHDPKGKVAYAYAELVEEVLDNE